jgi:hypothetical protein
VSVHTYLPDVEDRLLCKELFARREFPVKDVLLALQQMSQQDLLGTDNIVDIDVNAVLSKDGGLERAPDDLVTTDSITRGRATPFAG